MSSEKKNRWMADGKLRYWSLTDAAWVTVQSHGAIPQQDWESMRAEEVDEIRAKLPKEPPDDAA